jgi:glutamate N-acetyltransferase/amino-acid N-acetyltransferase
VQAIGGVLTSPTHPAPLDVDVAIEGVPVCSAGAAIPYDDQAVARAVQAPEVEYEIGLPGEGCETEVFFSDLSQAYVSVNADYTT